MRISAGRLVEARIRRGRNGDHGRSCRAGPRRRDPWGTVVLEVAPDNDPHDWIGARATLRGRSGVFVGDLDRLVWERAPGRDMPSLAAFDRDAIADVRLWAGTLRLATDLF